MGEEGQEREAEIGIPLILASLAPVSMSEFLLSVQQRCRSHLEDLKERCLLACPLALWMSKGFWSQCSPSASEFSKKSLLSFPCCEEVLSILIQVNETSFTFIFPYPYLRVACSWHMCF